MTSLVHSLKYACLLLLLLYSCADAGFLPSKNLGIIARYKRQYKIKLVKREVSKIANRVPHALWYSAIDFGKGYSSTTAIMFPVEVILNRQNIKENGYKDVVASSLRKASDWGQRSGMFKATETFLAEMRQEKDRWNSYMAAGISSTISRRKASRNVFDNLRAFCSGFGSAFAIDTVKSIAKENGAELLGSKGKP